MSINSPIAPKTYTLDLKDRKILYQLDLNSRQSNIQIAKKVGLSKDVVNYRIKSLDENGFIRGFYTIIDFYKLGYFSVRAYLKLINASSKTEEEIFLFLKNHNTVFFVNKIDGNFDVGIGTYVENITDFESFSLEFKQKFREFMGEEQISIFTKAYHFHRAYLLEKKFDEVDANVVGGRGREDFDAKDIEILKFLAVNARISTLDIATYCEMPATTVAFRIKQLEKKKIILAYRLNFNFEKFGYEYYKADLVLNDISRLKELSNFAHAHPNILYIDQTIGGSDFEFDVEVKNKKQFLQIIDEIKEKFPEIRQWSYFSVREYKKLLYFPSA